MKKNTNVLRLSKKDIFHILTFKFTFTRKIDK